MFLSQPGSPAKENISSVAFRLLSQLSSGGPNAGLKMDSSPARSENVPGFRPKYQPSGANPAAAIPPASAAWSSSGLRFGAAVSAASQASPTTRTRNRPGV